MTEKELVTKFMHLFRGYEHAHGTHALNKKADENGKIKGRAITHGAGAVEADYLNHLQGGTSLGLISLMEDDTCWFGCIDIDTVSPAGTPKLKETVAELEKRVRALELPLVVCQSKSGGAHLWFFCSEPIDAKLIQTKLTEWAAALGYGGVEVNPKQTTRVNDQDRGNWVNISYFGALTKEGTTRYGYKNGKPIPKLEDFLKYAQQMQYSADSLKEVKLSLAEEYNDAPPCLQHLATFGVDDGGRNNALANFAVYFKKKYPDSWQDKLVEFNFSSVKPQLANGEMQQIIKNISRKEYFYTCKVPPICNHCDKKLCAKRTFGITGGVGAGELFPIDNLTKCRSKDSVRWYAESQGHRLELTTEQLFNPSDMQRIFAEQFSTVIITGKRTDWLMRLKELMEVSDEVADPEDASEQGQFENLLANFFSATRPARNREEIMKGNAFIESGRIHFRSEDLMNYLAVRRFVKPPHTIWSWVKTLQGENKLLSVKGRKIRVWTLPEPEQFDNTKLELPAAVDMEEL